MSAPNKKSTPENVQINWRISQDLVRRIKLHSLQTGISASDLVAELIEKHVPDYSIVSPNGEVSS